MRKTLSILVIVSLFSSCYLFHYGQIEQTEIYKFNGIYLVVDSGFEYPFYNDSTTIYCIDTVPIVSFLDFEEVKKQKSRYGNIELYIKLNDKDKIKFAEATREHIGEKFVFILKNKLISAPVVNEEISGGELVISGADENIINEIVEYFKKIN